jgi:hypothetical protein
MGTGIKYLTNRGGIMKKKIDSSEVAKKLVNSFAIEMGRVVVANNCRKRQSRRLRRFLETINGGLYERSSKCTVN